MRARKNPPSGQVELFRTRLEDLIDDRHELVLLAGKLDWTLFERKLVQRLQTIGDAQLSQRVSWLDFSISNISTTKVTRTPWGAFLRIRIGSIFVATNTLSMNCPVIDAAKRVEVFSKAEMSEVNVDTTVQEKAIKYPTDGALVDAARRMLVRVATKEGIVLKQSYKFIGRKALMVHMLLKHRKNWKGARKQLRRLRTFLDLVN
jgi:IS5 family transposase